MKKILASLLFASSAFAQDCPPFMEAMTSSLRLPDGEGLIIAVFEFQGPTRSVVTSYEYPEVATLGPFPCDGTIEFVNPTGTNRRMRYRQSLLIPEGLVPVIPTESPELCWEAETNRLIGYFETSVPANEQVIVPIAWEVNLRFADMLADIDGNGRVDAADQGILMSDFGTSNPRSDLNNDGTVNSEDLGILLSQWSDYSEDVIETSDARFNADWDSADYIIAANITTDPVRGGNGQVRVPFLDWQWKA